MAQERGPKVFPKSPIGKAINYAIDHYDRPCRYVIDGRYRTDTNLVENGHRIVALTRKNYLFCKNHDAAEDATVMYTIMGCCKLAGVNVEAWLTRTSLTMSTSTTTTTALTLPTSCRPTWSPKVF